MSVTSTACSARPRLSKVRAWGELPAAAVGGGVPALTAAGAVTCRRALLVPPAAQLRLVRNVQFTDAHSLGIRNGRQ